MPYQLQGGSGTTWAVWVDTSTTGTSNITWDIWVNDVTASTTTNTTANSTPPPVQLSDAEAAEFRAVEEQRKAAAKQAQLDRVKAVKRAKKLLRSLLSPKQKRELTERQQFSMVGSEGGIYEIRQGRSGNVYRVDKEGRRDMSYCCHPREYVPDEDTMLAQKLALETDEGAFCELANASPVY